ncbi:MAG: nucleotidyltransferase domain-containing protein, partial [Terriglobia bacterium]
MTDIQSAAAAPLHQTRVSQWKQRLATQRAQLREEFSVRKSPRELLRRQSAMVDRLLKDLWAGHAMPRNVALAAVGGYGRGQLFPCSDVDLLILLPAPAVAALAGKIENLIGTLWDIGIEVG